MRKRIIILLVIIIVLLLMNVSPIYAAEGSIQDEIEENVDGQLNSLDTAELEKFIKSLDDNLISGNIKDYISDIINGKIPLTPESIITIVGGNFLKYIREVIPMCCTIIIICLLNSIIVGFKPNFMKNSTTEIVHFVCFSAILVVLLVSMTKLIQTVVATIKTMQILMNVIFPILTTMLTLLGGGVSAGAYSPLMAILSTVIANLIISVVVPIFIACMIFSIVGNISSSIKLDKLRNFLKSLAEWGLGLIFGLFFMVITAQGLISSAIDSVSVRAAKFALSSYVPILGGYLSDGFNVVLASSVLLKNAVGFTGLIVLFSVILAPLIELIIILLALKLVSGIVESFADKRVSDMLTSMSSNIVVLVSALLAIAFLFFVTVVLVIYSANLGVI